MRDGPALSGGVAMAWVLLLVAGLFEVVWACSMKLSNGFTHLAYSLITVVAMLASFALLSLAMRSLPLGTAYTIWTGIGAVGAFIVGIMFLGEQLSPVRLGAAVLIVGGLVLMKLSAH
jgi:quaternary ammonium compound-resistance protein SugE